jgi:hypothetical protein
LTHPIVAPVPKQRRRRKGQPPEQFSNNNLALDRKIKEAVGGLRATTQWSLMEFSDEDKELIADFILDWSNHGTGRPMASSTKKSYIDSLTLLSRYVRYERNGGGKYKPLKQMTRDDFFAQEEPKGYLRSLKPESVTKEEEEDDNEKWVNTYNKRGRNFLAFWKWWTQKDLPKEERQTPPQLKGYRDVKRRSKTSVKREHHWTAEEHRVFLKYCEDLRLACFHAIHREVGGRPDELLQLKLGDIKVETVPSTGKKVCRFWIGQKGKTENSYRPASISDAIPYFNVWAHVHPAKDWDNPEKAYLFPSLENKAKYRNIPLKPDSLRLNCYVRVIEKQFPKLLDRPEIPLEDKAALRSLIYDKPHYPYLRRHEFASEIAPTTSRLVFNQLMGHSPRSNLQDVYVQALGNEGVRELEIARGIRTREETLSPAQIELQPKYCWACGESNKHNAKFCFNCNVAISKEGMLEDKEKEAQAAREAEEKDREIKQLKQDQQKIMNNLKLIMPMLQKFSEKLRVENIEMRQALGEEEKAEGSIFK